VRRGLSSGLLFASLFWLVAAGPASTLTPSVDCSADPAALTAAIGAASSGDTLLVDVGAFELAR
jgi:hypothetical protein